MVSDREGKLVRFDKNGIGVVDVIGVDQYVYFTPKKIYGYVGQTVDELKSIGRDSWTDGKTVIVSGDFRPTGNVYVESVKLKL